MAAFDQSAEQGYRNDAGSRVPEVVGEERGCDQAPPPAVELTDDPYLAGQHDARHDQYGANRAGRRKRERDNRLAWP